MLFQLEFITMYNPETYDSSVEVRVLCNGGVQGDGGAAHLWLVKNSRWQIESSLLIGQ